MWFFYELTVGSKPHGLTFHMPGHMHRPSGERAATLLLLQLRKIQQETVRMNAALEYHMKYMRVSGTIGSSVCSLCEERHSKISLRIWPETQKPPALMRVRAAGACCGCWHGVQGTGPARVAGGGAEA